MPNAEKIAFLVPMPLTVPPRRPARYSSCFVAFLLATSLLVGFLKPANAGSFYKIDSIVRLADIIGGVDTGSPFIVTGFNDDGTVVGYIAGGTSSPHAFVWSYGVFTDINDQLGATSSMATCLNVHGMLAGIYRPVDNPGVQRGFVYQGGWVYTQFGAPDGGGGDIVSVDAINYPGHILGSFNAQDHTSKGFVLSGYDSSVSIIDPVGLQPPGFTTILSPVSINDNDQAVGRLEYSHPQPPQQSFTRGFYWSGDLYSGTSNINLIDASSFASNWRAVGVSNDGNAIGLYTRNRSNGLAPITGSFVYDGTAPVDLGSLGGGDGTTVMSILDGGVLFGTSLNQNGQFDLFSAELVNGAVMMQDLGPAGSFFDYSILAPSYFPLNINMLDFGSGPFVGFAGCGADSTGRTSAVVWTGSGFQHLAESVPAYQKFTTTSVTWGSKVLMNSYGEIACSGTDAAGNQVLMLLSSDPDIDNSGLPDSWEMQYYGHRVDPNALEIGGGGLTNLQAYQRGIDPTVLVSGATPIVSVVSGGSQSGAPGTFLGAPLKVNVTDLAGSPLVNARVTFRIVAGAGGQLAPTGDSSSFSNSLIVNTDADGNASAFLRLATGYSGHCLITASAIRSDGSLDVSNTVQFTATVLNTCGFPTAPSNIAYLVQSDGTVKITWVDDAGDATNFMVQGRMIGGDWQTLGTVAGNVSSFITPVRASGYGFYRVVAVNAYGHTAGNPSSYGKGPTVVLTSPADGAETTVHGRFFLTAIALHSGAAIAKVEFFDGITKIGETAAAPFAAVWNNVPAGAHVISAIATDATGARGVSAPVNVSSVGFVSIAAAGYQSFALQLDGTLWAWGNDDYGQLGLGTYGRLYDTPTKLDGISGIQAVTSGSSHTLILNADGTVSAFGDNSSFQLGTGNTISSSVPMTVLGLEHVKAIAAGGYQSMALVEDGSVWTWGTRVDYGQEQYVPTKVAGLPNVIAIAAGDGHFLALAADHSVWAWGWNLFGQLGIGGYDDQDVPVQVVGLTDVNVIATGPEHSVAITSQGTVYTWGDNTHGQLGQGGTNSNPSPSAIINLPAASAVATKGSHVLILTTTGAVWAFGDNERGQVGDPATYQTNGHDSSPFRVEYLPPVIQIAAGSFHSMAVSADGEIFTWGDNTNGQLGTGDSLSPTSVNFQNVSVLNSTANPGDGNASSGGGINGTPNPGGGGNGPTLDPDQTVARYLLEAPYLFVGPSFRTNPQTGSGTEADSMAQLYWEIWYTTPQSMVIQRRDSGGDWMTIGSPAAGDTDYDDDGLNALISYEYRIKATFPGGIVSYSNTASYYIPLVTRFSTKRSLGQTVYKENSSIKEFSNGALSAKPRYYLNKLVTANYTSTDDPNSVDGNALYAVTHDPSRHFISYWLASTATGSHSGGKTVHSTEYYDWSHQGRTRGQMVEEYTYTSIGSNDQSDSSGSTSSTYNKYFDVKGTYTLATGVPRWTGTDFDTVLGDIDYSGTYQDDYTYHSTDKYGNSTSHHDTETANLAGDSNLGPMWTGSLTADGVVTPVTNLGFPPQLYLDTLDFGGIIISGVEKDVAFANVTGSIVLSNLYDTSEFIQNTVNDLPDFPQNFTDSYLAGAGSYSAYPTIGASYIGNRKFASSEDSLSIEKFVYKFKTNPSDSASLGFNVLFVPDRDPSAPNVAPVPKLVTSFTIVGTGGDSAEYTLDPATVPDQLQAGSKSGQYYLVPAFHVVASGNIADPNPHSPFDQVTDLDAQERSSGSAVLMAPDNSGDNAKAGELSLYNWYDDWLFYANSGVDPASLSYNLTWTNGADVTVTDPWGTVVNSGLHFTQADVANGIDGLRYKVVANANAHDGERITFTISTSFGDQSLGQETITYTVKVRSLHDYSVPFDEASGARYRKIGLDGRPMQDEKPQHTAENDQEKEQTYVDALTLGLRHSTTDIYVPISGSDLVLAVRRDSLSEVWNMRNGLRPHERFDRPFGAGWSSNLAPTLDVNYKENQPIYYYIIDQNGASHRFVAASNGTAVPLPSDERENGDYLSSFDPHRFVFTDRFGTKIQFDSNTAINVNVPGDRYTVSAGDNHNYYRTISVSDRLGYRLDYTYPAEAKTLIPSTVSLADHPDQTLYIRQDSVCRVTETWDPNGNHFHYTYDSNGQYTVNGITCEETVLTKVTGPDGQSVNYTYDQLQEADQTPSDLNQGEPIDQVHLDLKSIQNPKGKTTSFEYALDQSRFNCAVTVGGLSYYQQTGGPRNVKTVSLPGVVSQTQFANKSKVKLQFTNGVIGVTGDSVRKSEVTDIEGNLVTYTFGAEQGGTQVFDVAGIYPETPAWAVPRIIFYTSMNVAYPDNIGSETFFFDPTAGLSLASAKDLCGNITSYTHLSPYANASAYHAVLACPNQSNFFGYFEDPDTQTNAAPNSRSFTYTASSLHLLSDVTDEEGRRTHYEFDAQGRRIEEDIYFPSNTLVQKTTFVYNYPSFPGFLSQQTIWKLGLTNDPTTRGGNLVTQYVPDHSGRVAQKIVVNPSDQNLVTSYEYDNNGNKLSETDPRLHATYFTYDERNRLTYVTYPDGSQKHLVYDPNGNKKEEWDENNHATLFEYDELNRIIRQARDMNGNGQMDVGVDLITKYTYDHVNKLTTVTDPNGNTTTKHHDALQRVTQIDQPLLPSTHLYYDLAQNCGGNVFDSSSFYPTRIVDSANYVTFTSYDALYRPLTVSRQYKFGADAATDPTPATQDKEHFATVSTGYDHVGNPTSQTDARGYITSTSFDALNRPYHVVYPDSTAANPDDSWITYTSTGLKWKEQDRCQKITETRYDGAGRPTDVYAPAVYDAVSQTIKSPHTQTVFDQNGNIIAIINPRLYETDFTYDVRNRRTDEYDAAVFDADSGLTLRPHIHTDYDDAGNKTAVKDARGYTTTYLPDPANRITLVTSPAVPLDGDSTQLYHPTTQTTYDLNDNVVRITDANTHGTDNYYDALNRLWLTVNSKQEAVRYGYDDLGNRTSVDAGLRMVGSINAVPVLVPGSNPQTSTFTFDGLKRNISTVYPSAVTTFEYNDAVKLSRLDGNGHLTQYDQYDACGRLKHVSYPDSPLDSCTYSYDNNSRLLSVTDGHGAVTGTAYSYDALGRVQTETSNSVTHTYQYDLAGNRMSAQYGLPSGGNGRHLLSAYDSLNRLWTLKDGSNTTTYRYDLNGNVRQKWFPNGEVETTNYDAMGRQSDSSDQTGSGALLYAYNYGHDPLGNLTSMVEYKVGLSIRCVGMSYYNNDRLQNENIYEGASKNAPLASSTTYTYDEMGNRTRRQVAGSATTTYHYNAVGQLHDWSDTSGNSVTYGYDGNGNRKSRIQNGATDTYVYDIENRLLSLSQGTTGTNYDYLYDYRTRRVNRTEAGTATNIVFSGGTSVQEYAGGSVSTAPSVEFVRGSDWGGGTGGILYSVRTGGGTNFDHYDGRGDVATQTSAAGTVTYQAQYEAWGTHTAEFGSDQDRQRANTKEEDPTGLLNEGMRYRDLETGVFLTRDPAGMIDGPNLYAYVNQNPWTKFDPEGLAVVSEPDPAEVSDHKESIASSILEERSNLTINSLGNKSLLGPGHADGSVAAEYLPQDRMAAREDWSPIKRADGKPGWVMANIPVLGSLAKAASHFGMYGEEGQMWGSLGWAGVDAVTLGRGSMLGKTAKVVVEEAGERALAAKTLAPRNPNVYEALFEAPISGASRGAHRASANRFLANELGENVDLATMFNQELGTDVLGHMQSGSSLLNPPGTVWHHPFDNPNVMQLLRTGEHTNPALQSLLHPEGVGGFGNFYGQ